MHGRGPKAGAPASNGAGRGRDAADRASVPRRATWQVPNQADAAEVGADSAEISADAAKIGPTRSVSACIGRNGWVRPKFKKKKKVQTHRFTNLKTPRPLTFRPTLSNSLSHSVPHLPSLCHCAPSLIYLLCVSGSLCECSVLLQPSVIIYYCS